METSKCNSKILMDGIQQLEEKGFFIIRNVVEPSLINHTLKKIKQDWQTNSAMWHSTSPLRDNSFLFHPELLFLLEHELICGLCELALGLDWRLDHIMTVKSRITATSNTDITAIDLATLHGGPFSNGGLNHWLPGFDLNRPFARCGRLNIAIPITAGDRKIGNAVFMQGSHICRDYVCCMENQNGLGGAPVNYLQKLQQSCPIVIPEVNPGDIFFFVDALYHGTTQHTQERLTVYLMTTPGTATLMDYNSMARPYFEVAETKNQKARLLPPWYFLRNGGVYDIGQAFYLKDVNSPYVGHSSAQDINRIKFIKENFTHIKSNIKIM